MPKLRILLLPFATLPIAAQAIVIRDDRPDQAYVDLAKRYKAVCQIAGNGHGTLIAPTWVLTAAHVTDVLGPFSRFVTFGERRYKVAAYYLHPTATKLPLRDRFDLALVQLAEPVKGIKPVELYVKSDELDKVITFVGAGDTGNGKSGPQRNDGKWRAARNRIAAVRSNKIEFTFDAPPKGEDLEGISGPGDSGGPALFEANGKTYIMGVSSYNSGRGMPECTYGTTEHYARVSQARDWIAQVQKESDPMRHNDPVVDFKDVPDTNPMTAVVQAYLEAFNSGKADAVEAFNLKFRGAGFLADTTPEIRLRRAESMMETYGRLEPRKASLREGGSIAVLVKSGKTGGWHSFEFLPVRDQSGKLAGIMVGLAEPP